jgi:hypothetical protein
MLEDNDFYPMFLWGKEKNPSGEGRTPGEQGVNQDTCKFNGVFFTCKGAHTLREELFTWTSLPIHSRTHT